MVKMSNVLTFNVTGVFLVTFTLFYCASTKVNSADYYYQRALEMEKNGSDQFTILATLELAHSIDPNLEGLQDKLQFYQDNVNIVDRKERISDVVYSAAPLGKPINSEGDDAFPVITPDGNTILFTSRRIGSYMGSEDFWMCKKVNGIWQPAENLGPKINSNSSEGAASITPDMREIYFSSASANGDLDIFFAEMEGLDWSDAQNIGSHINSPQWDSHPSVSSDGRELYFASARGASRGGARDIWMAKRDKQNRWFSVQNLGSQINTEYDETSPFIHYDGKTLYFSSNRPGGNGGHDIYMSRRVNGIWQNPRNLGPKINTADKDYNYSISFDGKMALITRFVESSSGKRNSKIYSMMVPDSIKPAWTAYIQGEVIDGKSGGAVEADICLTDLRSSKEITKTKSNSITGKYLVVLPVGKIYNLQVTSSNYIKYEEKLDVRNVLPMQNIQKEFTLFPVERKKIIRGVIWDYYHDKPIGGSMITVEDASSGEVIAIVFSDYENGQYIAEVPFGSQYRLSASCTGYWPDWYEVPEESPETAAINMEYAWDVRLKLFEETVKERVPYQVEMIYFDFDQSSLRQESYGVLNRLFNEILHKYPDYGFKIMGHTDNVGDDQYNLDLSRERANVVKDYWYHQGIPLYRMIAEGYGETNPVASNDSEEDRQKNRRTELLPIPIEEMYKQERE